MAGKPKDESRDAIMTFRMPRELHKKLVDAAGERSVSEEMRRRLEASLEGRAGAAADERTAGLLDQLNTVAKIVRESYGEWSTDPGAFAVFRAAIDKYVERWAPEGEPVLKPTPRAIKFIRGATTIDEAANMVAFAAFISPPGGGGPLFSGHGEEPKP